MSQETFERRWDAAAYLKQYYAGPDVSDDEVANAEFAARQLRALGRTFPHALEFGCGPTLHHAATLVPYVQALDLADYVPTNLEQIALWLKDDPIAHDWDPYLTGGALKAEGAWDADTLIARKAALRRVIAELRTGAAARRRRALRPGSVLLLCRNRSRRPRTMDSVYGSPMRPGEARRRIVARRHASM